jgi:hypothetical protein
MAKITNSTFTSIEDSCVTAFRSVVSVIKPIQDMQNGVEPATPYCHIFVVSEAPVGMSSESATVNSTTRITTMCQPYEALVRFVFVGKDKQSGGSDTNAANYAEDFHLKMQSIYYRALFADNGLSVLRVSPNRRSQQKRETDIYSVSTIDLSLAYDKHLSVTFQTIDHGEINGTLTEANNVDGTLPVTFTY